MRKTKSHVSLKEHLVQPFDIPLSGQDRSYLSSGFCEADESTTIFRRRVFEGESDVCDVECALCGGPVITRKDSTQLSSSYSPEIVGCLIQKEKTLSFVVETSLSQYDFVMVKDAILAHLQRHDFTALFHRINVYHSGVNSLLKTKTPPRRSLLSTRKLKSITEEIKPKLKKQESQEQEEKSTQDKEDKRQRKELAESAKRLLKELPKLSTNQEQEKEKTKFNRSQNSQRTSRNLQEKLSKAEGTLFRKQIQKFVMKDSVYD